MNGNGAKMCNMAQDVFGRHVHANLES